MVENFSSMAQDLMSDFSYAISDYLALIFIVLALVSLFFALFGYKLFKLFVAFVSVFVGFGLGFVIGTIIMAVVPQPILIPVFGVVFSVILAIKAWKNPSIYIDYLVGIPTFVLSMYYFMLKMLADNGGSWPSAPIMIFKGILLPIIITVVVCGFLAFIQSAVVVLGTSYGGAYGACIFVMKAMELEVNLLVPIIITVIVGTLCLLFQIKYSMGGFSVQKFFFGAKKNKAVKEGADD